MVIGQGEGVAVLLTEQAELALEVGAPDLIDPADGRQRLPVSGRAAAMSAGDDEPFTLQDIADSAGGRHIKRHLVINQPGADFFGSPVGMCYAHINELLNNLRRQAFSMCEPGAGLVKREAGSSGLKRCSHL
ncbi:hypothetical protein ACSPAB_09820 [Buttiauxella agrestis]